MRDRRPVGHSLYPLLLLTAASGCQALHVYRPVGILVRDAETKKPIPAAEVSLTYPLCRDSLAPHDSSGVTGQDGVARLRAAAYGEHGVELATVAPGYLTEEKLISLADVEKVSPARWFEDTNLRPPCFVVEVYAGPAFAVELVVPKGYRGLVKAEIQIRDDLAATPGQRCFRIDVSPSGAVRVVGPSLLRRVDPPTFRACYAGGARLDGAMGEEKVGFRWLKTEGAQEYFVVGTQAAYDRFCRLLLWDEDHQAEHSSEGGRGGGRGGRRHRGGQTPSP